MNRRVRARLSRTVTRLLGWLASQSPGLAFIVSDALAMFRRIASRAEVRALFPNADTGQVLRRMSMTHVRTQLVAGWIGRAGIAPFRRLVRKNDALAQLRPPMILGTFHIGPTLGVGVLTERLKGETLVLRGSVGSTDQERAATFHRSIDRLRTNGFVVLAFDPYEAQRIAVPFLGRTLQLARGPFAMARIARVPILPVVARWVGEEVELIVGDPLPAGNEQTMAEAAGRWLEGYLREQPGELSYRLRELMGR